MQVRWHNYDGFVADNTGVDGDYLTWDFGAMGHGQQAMVHVTVPVTRMPRRLTPAAAMTTDDYDSGEDLDEIVRYAGDAGCGAAGNCHHHHCDSLPVPGGAAASAGGIDPETGSGTRTAFTRSAAPAPHPPPSGYHRTDPPPEFRAGGGKTRGGGGEPPPQHHSGCASSCACACASSCACACACAGGGRAGCSVKEIFTP